MGIAQCRTVPEKREVTVDSPLMPRLAFLLLGDEELFALYVFME